MNTRNDGELFSLYNFFRVITLFAFLLSASSTVTAKFGDMVADLNVTAEKFAVDSTRNRIYVSVSSANQVAVIDVNSLSIISQINVSPSPSGVYISPDGSSLYVTSTVLPELAIIDLNTFIPYDYIPLPSPGYDVVAGNGDQVFVTPATQGPGIMNLDVASRITTEFNAGIFIYKNGLLEISPDRNTLYFANSGISPGTLARFDVSMPAPILLTSNPHAALGSNGKDLTLTADGMFVSYAVGGGNTQYDIHKLQSNDFSLVGSFLTGPYPNEITYSADGSLAFTVHTAGQIDIFDAYTFIEQQPITVTGEAHELIVDSSGRYLFAAFADSLRVYSVLDAVTPLPWLPDPGLQACLEEQVIQNQWQFAEEVTTFHCISHGVQDLAGMDIFSRLKVLDLSDNQISIISPLSSISGLQSLNIGQNNISDLMPLDQLRQLSDLDVSANNLTSLNGLTGNTQLTRLVLSGNPNLSMSEVMMVLDNNPGLTHLGLAGLPLGDLNMLPLFDETTGQPYKLVELDISNTGIANLAQLSTFPTLVSVNVSNNQLVNLSPLGILPQLTHLDASDNRILDIMPLMQMTQLKKLDISGNQGINPQDAINLIGQNHQLTHLGLGDIPITDLFQLPLFNPVAGIPYALEELNISNTKINNIQRLIEFPALKVLNISGNNLGDITPLQQLAGLQQLTMQLTNVSSLIPLSGLTQLKTLDVSGNAMIPVVPELVDVIHNNPKLTRLGLGDIPIADLFQLPLFNPATGMPYALEELNLINTQITNIQRLVEFPLLRKLNIGHNNISDLMPLDPLRQLSDLDVSANNLTSLNGLTGNTQLTRLVLSGNPNLSMSEVMMVLDNNPGLTHLGLADLSLADLDMLPLIDETTGQPYKLVDLDISNTGIDNITRLNGLPASEVLALRSLMISDISPLFNLPSLYSVDLFDSNQLQCSDLDALENKLGPDAVNRPLSCIMDNPPVITMYEPVNGVQVEADGLLTLSATASDVEDGNLDSLIQWTSNLDGVLGNGGSLSVTLSVGQHLITASVVDSSGQNAFVTVNVEVAATSVAYCPSSGTSTSYEWINGVVFNGIPNITGNNNGYGDYTSMVFNLQAGINYPLQLTPGFRYGSYNEYWSVWIDFDQNGIFDTSERVFYGSSRASINSVITIPAGANTGITRMRVGMRYGGTPSACGNFTWGEVEDYNINILN